MFKYSEKTKDGRLLKLLDLFKLIRANKEVKKDAEIVESIYLQNILSPNTTNLEQGENVKEIYVIDINLKTRDVPKKFMEALNKGIFLQTLFRIYVGTKVKYLVPIKQFNEDGAFKILKTVETDWIEPKELTFPITSKLENVFKAIVAEITNYQFRTNESFGEYVERLDIITKTKADIKKLTKTMDATNQPNKKMAYNDQIKILKKELQEMEDNNG